MIKLLDILKELNIQPKTPIGKGGEQTAYPSKIKPGFVIKKFTSESEFFTKENWAEIIETAQQHPEIFAQIEKVDFDKGYVIQEKLDEKSLTKDGNELYDYLKDNNILYRNSSVIEAKEKTKINGINHCVNGHQKTAGGYIWVYKHPENPYFEYIVNENEVIRVFENNDDLGTEELWYRDLEDRTLEIIGETDWKIQLDNQLPILLENNIFIPKHEFHRVIKGTGTLKLKIHK